MMTKSGTGRRSWSETLSVIAVQIVTALGAATTASAATETVLWSFTGGADGANPYAGLTLKAGTLYGATFYGGANGQGVVFQIPTSAGTLTTLYAFQGNIDRAAAPAGTPILDTSNNILGTVAFNSVNSQGTGSGYGSVYELVSNGTSGYTFQNLHNFASGSDGANPYALLSGPDGNGNYYSATTAGGSSSDGIVFKVTKASNGGYSCCTNLHSFAGGSTDGINGYGGILYYNNYLYGATVLGGNPFKGIIYKISSSGGSLALLRAFTGTNGGFPRSGLINDGAGNLFGTASTYGTGSSSGSGDAFLISSSSGGDIAVQHSFTGSDGSTPWATPTFDSSGNLYGTTTSGGAYGYGVVYKLSGTTYTNLYSFTGGSDGANPYASLTFDPTTGNLYGTTVNGGANGKGVVFKITP